MPSTPALYASPPPYVRLPSAVRSRLPYIVLAISLSATLLVTLVVNRVVTSRERETFAADASLAKTAIERRTTSYINLIRSAGQVYFLTPSPGPATFYRYAEGLELEDNYPGIRGLGTSLRIPNEPAMKRKLMASFKKHIPGYRLWPEGTRKEYHTIVALFPLDEWNRRAIGYDMHSEPVRADAMDRARDSGTPSVTGRVTLVQDEPDNPQPGFLIYAPLYLPDNKTPPPSQRASKLIGFSYAAFRMGEVFGGVFRRHLEGKLQFEVSDVTNSQNGRGSSLYRSWEVDGRPKLANAPFRHHFRVRVADRTWHFEVLGSPEYIEGSGRALVNVTAIAGAAISLLLFGMTRYQNRAQRELEDRQHNIELLNEHLRRAMRETHHRVKNNLQVITAMIDMQALDADGRSRQDLRRLSMHVMGLATVHDVLTEQARLAGDGDGVSAQQILHKLLPLLEPMALGRQVVLHVDDATLSSRQGTSLAIVINELVSNAIKYGRGTVHISFATDGSFGRLRVADDGPGFPEDFNTKRTTRTGLQLVESLSVWDLGGGVHFENGSPSGAVVTVEVALKRSETGARDGEKLLDKKRGSWDDGEDNGSRT